MPDQGQRTEKPTKRKLDKARKEGQFPSSREFLAALQFLTFAALLSAGGAGFLDGRARWRATSWVRPFVSNLARTTSGFSIVSRSGICFNP